MDEEVSVQSALSQATIKLRSSLLQGAEVLSPSDSQPIQIDPVMSSFFGVEHADAGIASKVSKVEEWLESQHCKTHEEKLNALKSIETRMGEGPMERGSRLDRLYNYVTLRTKASTLTHQANALLK